MSSGHGADDIYKKEHRRMEKITKDDIIAAQAKYRPSIFVGFMVKYFSVDSKMNKSAFKRTVNYTLIALFVIGFLMAVTKASRRAFAFATFSLFGILFVLAALIFIARALNNKNVRKIAKHLGVTVAEYEQLCDRLL